MDDKEKKIKDAFNMLSKIPLAAPTLYDVTKLHQRTIKILNDLYEAGRVEGELSKIKED